MKQTPPLSTELLSLARQRVTVEAKKVAVGPQNVLTQAERYAKGLRSDAYNFSGYRGAFPLRIEACDQCGHVAIFKWGREPPPAWKP